MGSGMCSRRQKKIVQFLLLITVVFGLIYGGMVSYEMHKQLKRTEATALKYQQHQESLSAQLQVVYEHRSRLEKSLQKERLEHKKAKEDYLVYKMEAEQSLNKEKQDAGSRFNSLHIQHQMLKNQHDDLKKQFYELQDQHQVQGEDHSKALDDHKQRFDQLQHMKEMEISKLKENVYNLREENKQLRKAHQDIHVQLQDTRQQHKELKSAHDDLTLTLEDHKNALAVAQVQVNEFKQLKETLNRMPSLRHGDPGPARNQAPPAALHPDGAHVHEDAQAQHQEVAGGQPRLKHSVDAALEKEGEAERRRELAEEEMEQAGQPERLEEESDQPQGADEEETHNRPDENANDPDKLKPEEAAPAQPDRAHAQSQVERVKSAYEQQQEQQRAAVRAAEERRRLQLRQEALQEQRAREQRAREELQREQRAREEQQHREADRKEQLLREEQHRKKNQYEHMDNDIVQGEEDHHIDEEERDARIPADAEVGDNHVPQHLVERPAETEDVDPENDPNNQGEDEFEEAEEQQHPRPGGDQEEGGVAKQGNAHVVIPHQHVADEQLVMAGNPDQQEDNLDEQYQEEGEEEDLAGRREEEAEPYNKENGEHGLGKPGVPAKDQPRKDEEENYEEEEEEEGGQDTRTNRRAEM